MEKKTLNDVLIFLATEPKVGPDQGVTVKMALKEMGCSIELYNKVFDLINPTVMMKDETLRKSCLRILASLERENLISDETDLSVLIPFIFAMVKAEMRVIEMYEKATMAWIGVKEGKMKGGKVEKGQMTAKDVKAKGKLEVVLDLVCEECCSPLSFVVRDGNQIAVVPCRKCRGQGDIQKGG